MCEIADKFGAVGVQPHQKQSYIFQLDRQALSKLCITSGNPICDAFYALFSLTRPDFNV